MTDLREEIPVTAKKLALSDAERLANGPVRSDFTAVPIGITVATQFLRVASELASLWLAAIQSMAHYVNEIHRPS